MVFPSSDVESFHLLMRCCHLLGVLEDVLHGRSGKPRRCLCASEVAEQKYGSDKALQAIVPYTAPCNIAVGRTILQDSSTFFGPLLHIHTRARADTDKNSLSWRT